MSLHFTLLGPHCSGDLHGLVPPSPCLSQGPAFPQQKVALHFPGLFRRAGSGSSFQGTCHWPNAARAAADSVCAWQIKLPELLVMA